MNGKKDVQCNNCLIEMVWDRYLGVYKCSICGRQVSEESVKNKDYSKKHILVKKNKKAL
ncbi:MAG: hypothetical protein WDA21_02000 [Bacilli bacterium]